MSRLALCIAAFALIGCAASVHQSWAGPSSGPDPGFTVTCPQLTLRSTVADYVRGYGRGSDATAAFDAARANAMRAMREKLRDAHSTTVFRAYMRNFNLTLGPRHYDRATGQACIIGILEKSGVPDQMRAATTDFEQKLAALARAVNDKTRPLDTLKIEPPQWGVGGDAGQLGHSLYTHIQGAFEERALVEARARYTLGGRLAPTQGGDRCKLIPQLKDRQGRLTPLASIEFDARVLNARCEAPKRFEHPFIADEFIQTPGGDRLGSDGLQVVFTTVTPDHLICGGELFDLKIYTDRPADVRLYSVAADGRVMFGWPQQRVDGEVSLESIATRLEGEQGYRIVAVAVPAGEPFGGFRPDTYVGAPGGCLGRGGLRAADFPKYAAIATYSHGVLAPGAAGCPNTPEDRHRHDALLRQVRALPFCARRP